MASGVIGESRKESVVVGGIGDSGDGEIGGEEVADTGEGVRVLGTEIPNPRVLRERRESTVSGVCWGADFYDCLANDTR